MVSLMNNISSGWTKSAVVAMKLISKTVHMATGELQTVDIMKTSLSPAWTSQPVTNVVL